MNSFSEKAKSFIKCQGKIKSSYSELLDLSTLQLYTLVSTEFQSGERESIFKTLRKVYYINHILIWKLFYFVCERKLVQSEFKLMCEKWTWIENIINVYNKSIESNMENKSFIPIIESASKDFAPITIFKSGKIQLQNRHIQREFEKLRNKHKKKLIIHCLISSLLEEYIEKYELSEFINDDIKHFIEELNSDLAHDKKFSTNEYFIKYAFTKDSEEKKEAKKYAVYPTPYEGVYDLISDSMYSNCNDLLFGNLEQIEKWQKEQWNI